MKIATKTRYGLRFMIDLAQHWGEGPQSMRLIAERQEVSKKYLEQVVAPLSSNGLIIVSRGHMGGYELARDPKEITLADIMDATEGDLNLLDCIEDTHACARFDHCFSFKVWHGLQDVIVDYLASQTLQDLID